MNSPRPTSPATSPLVVRGARVLVCVTGGIAAYKTAALVSRLAQNGAEVTVAMSPAATRFVQPLTFEALSARRVYTSVWDQIEHHDSQHIALAGGCDLAVVAPCTFDCIGRLATGRADDVVTLILSAIDRRRTPVLLAPSMNAAMWSQPSLQRNIETLRADGFTFVGPDDGWQACRTTGTGRMSEPAEIFDRIAAMLTNRGKAT